MADLASIERFLYREAGLLDKPDLDSWLALYTEDAWYWIPAQEEQPDALNHVSHVYDDRVMMEIRRRNFVHPGRPQRIGRCAVAILLATSGWTSPKLEMPSGSDPTST